MVHEYAYFYEYIWKIVYCIGLTQQTNEFQFPLL